MKKIFAIIITVAFCLVLCACGQSTDKIKESTEPTATSISEQEQTFPFEDSEGRTRYRLFINGKEVETKNYPFTKPDDPKSGYYPLNDVLSFLGVDCLCSEDKTTLTTALNGNTIKVTADVAEMTYGKSTMTALDKNIKPMIVDGVLYVPSFFLMKLSDNSIVDFSGDRTAATLETDVVIDLATSGTAALGSSGGSNSAGTGNSGHQHCSRCGGAGGYNEQYFDQVLVNGQWKQIPKSRWVTCPACGGSGYE